MAKTLTTRGRKDSARAKEDGAIAQTLVEKSAPDGALRRAMIAEAAYFKAEQRGFAPGHEVEDWLSCESELDARLQSRASDLAIHPAITRTMERGLSPNDVH